MATLDFSESDLIKIRSSWADVMAANQFSDAYFVQGLFSDLMARDASLHTMLDKGGIRQQQEALFSELLKFTMMYLDRAQVLDECTEEFVKENPSVAKYGNAYLEPMGAVFIQHLRKTVGAKSFHAGLETLWVKLYIYVANCILSSEASDVDSVMSNANASSASEDLEEVQPLRPKSFSSPVPVFKPLLPPTNTISIDLGKNAKYKGFRRSVNEAPNSPIAVSVAAAGSSFRPPAPAFVQDDEPEITPRSPRRAPAAQLDLAAPPSPRPAFDPRRSHRKTAAQSNIVLHPSARKPSVSSVESAVSDVEDQLHLEDEIDFRSVAVPRSPVFDHSSFGINGLAPIAESDDDEKSFKDNGSSAYDASPSLEVSSSRTSSLSLHHSDYKSSISSAQSRPADKAPRQQHHEPGFAHSGASYSSPYTHAACSGSMPSLSSRNGGQRASLGFMRSSYILKKEMHDLGYNHPENAVSASHIATRPKAVLPSSRSVSSLPARHSSFLHPNAGFTSNDAMVAPPTIISRPAVRAASIASSDDRKRGSFREKLSRLFGKPAKVSAPLPPASEAAPAPSYGPPSSGLSATGSRNSAKRLTSTDVRSHAPSGYACSVYSRPMTFHDNASTVSDGKSTRSFFGKKEKKQNKYLVKKVPYKTIYLKDIVS